MGLITGTCLIDENTFRCKAFSFNVYLDLKNKRHTGKILSWDCAFFPESDIYKSTEMGKRRAIGTGKSNLSVSKKSHFSCVYGHFKAGYFQCT